MEAVKIGMLDLTESMINRKRSAMWSVHYGRYVNVPGGVL